MDASDIILECVNTMEFSSKKYTKISELADSELLVILLHYCIAEKQSESSISKCNIAEEIHSIFKEHFAVVTPIVAVDKALAGNEEELSILFLLLIYASLMSSVNLRNKITQSSMTVEAESKLKYLFECIQRRGQAISRRYLEILLQENLTDKGKSQTPNQKSSPKAYSNFSKLPKGFSPVRTLFQSPSFRMQRALSEKNKDVKRMQQQIVTLESEKLELEVSNATLIAKKGKIEADRQKILDQYHELRRELDASECKAINAEQEVSKHVMKLQKRTSDLQKENEALVQKNQEIADDNFDLTTKLENVHKRLKLANAERDKLVESLDSMEHKCRSQESLIGDQYSELKVFKSQLEELQQYLQENSKSFNQTIEESFDGVLQPMDISMSSNASMRLSMGKENMGTAVVDILLSESQQKVTQLQQQLQEVNRALETMEQQNNTLQHANFDLQEQLHERTKEAAKISKQNKDTENQLQLVTKQLKSVESTLEESKMKSTELLNDMENRAKQELDEMSIKFEEEKQLLLQQHQTATDVLKENIQLVEMTLTDKLTEFQLLEEKMNSLQCELNTTKLAQEALLKLDEETNKNLKQYKESVNNMKEHLCSHGKLEHLGELSDVVEIHNAIIEYVKSSTDAYNTLEAECHRTSELLMEQKVLLKSKEEEFEIQQTKVVNLEAEIKDSRLAKDDANKECFVLNKQLNEIEEEKEHIIVNYEELLVKSNSEKDTLTQKVSAIECELKEVEQQNLLLKDSVNQMQQHKDTLFKEIESKYLEKKEELEAAVQTNQLYQVKLKDMENSLKDHSDMVLDLTTQQTALNEDKKSLILSNQNKDDEICTLNESLRKSQSDFQYTNQLLTKLQEENHVWENRMNELMSDTSGLQKEIIRKDEIIAQHDQTILKNKDIIQKLEEEKSCILEQHENEKQTLINQNEVQLVQAKEIGNNELSEFSKKSESEKVVLRSENERLVQQTKELLESVEKLNQDKCILLEQIEVQRKQTVLISETQKLTEQEKITLMQEVKELESKIKQDKNTLSEEFECKMKEVMEIENRKASDLQKIIQEKETLVKQIQLQLEDDEKEKQIQKNTILEKGALIDQAQLQLQEVKELSLKEASNYKIQLEESDSRCVKLSEEKNDLEEQLKKKDNEYQSLTKTILDFENQIKELSHKVVTYEAQLKLAEEKLANAVEEAMNSKTLLEDTLRNQCKKADLEQQTSQCQSLKFEKESIQNECDILSQKCQFLEAKNQVIQSELLKKTEKLCEMESQCLDSNQKVICAKEELIKLEHESRKTIENLKDNLRNASEKANEEKKLALQKLKNTYREQMDKIIQKADEQEKSMEDYERIKPKYEMAKQKLSETIDELNHLKNSSVLYQNKLQVLKTHVSKLNENLREEKTKSQELSEKVAKYQSERDPIKQKIAELEATVKRYANENRSLNMQLKFAENSIRDMKKDHRRQSYIAGLELDDSLTPLIPKEPRKENLNMEPPRYSTRSSLRLSTQLEHKPLSQPTRNTRQVQSDSNLKKRSTASKINVQSPKLRQSLSQSIPRDMMASFRCEDEEFEFSDNAKLLADIQVMKPANDGERLSRLRELQRRNSLYPPHMRSAYRAEFQEVSEILSDEQIRNGSIVKGIEELDLSSPPAHNTRKRKSIESSVPSTPNSPRKLKRLSSSTSSLKTPKLRSASSTSTLRPMKDTPNRKGRTPSSILKIMSRGKSPWRKLRSDERPGQKQSEKFVDRLRSNRK